MINGNCNQCGARLKLLAMMPQSQANGPDYPDYEACANCGYGNPARPPVTSDEIEEIERRIIQYKDYERSLVIQDFYRLLWMVKRAHAASAPVTDNELFVACAVAYNEGRAHGLRYPSEKAPITDDEIFAARVPRELDLARRLFPAPNAMLAALVEEVGEIAKAMMYEPWSHVVSECLQVATMAQRLAVEGDQTMRIFRFANGNDDMPEWVLVATEIMPEGKL